MAIGFRAILTAAVLSLASLLRAAGSAGSGENVASVVVGSRVRVTQAHSVLAGSLLATNEESLTVAGDGSKVPALIRRSDVTRLEVSRGKHSAAVWGALGGAVVFGVLSYPAWQACGDCSGSPPAAMVIGFAVGGGLIGALIGSLITSDRWHEVPVSSVQIGIAPLVTPGGRLGVSLSVGFR
jgi:hypothetical protein